MKVIPLKKILNERGQLIEVQRNDDDHFLGFGQVYLTETKSGVVKAWYRHSKQTDQLAIIKGAALLVLYDTRESSPTYKSLQEIYLTETQPVLVQIPSGIWHGFMANTSETAFILHLNTTAWNPLNPDEERLCPDDSSIPFVWPK